MKGQSYKQRINVRRALGRQRGANVASNLGSSTDCFKIRLDDARRKAGAQRQSLFASVANTLCP